MRYSPPGVVGGTEDTLRSSAVPDERDCGLTFALRKEMRQETGHQRAFLLGEFVTLRRVGVNGKNLVPARFGGLVNGNSQNGSVSRMRWPNLCGSNLCGLNESYEQRHGQRFGAAAGCEPSGAGGKAKGSIMIRGEHCCKHCTENRGRGNGKPGRTRA